MGQLGQKPDRRAGAQLGGGGLVVESPVTRLDDELSICPLP